MKLAGLRLVENAHDESFWAAMWLPANDSCPALLLTGSFDKSVRLWRPDKLAAAAPPSRATSSASSPPPPTPTAPSDDQMLRLRGAPLAAMAQVEVDDVKKKVTVFFGTQTRTVEGFAKAYASEEEEDRAEEPHPINGGVLGKKKMKKTKTKKKKMVVVDSSHEHEDSDSLISPVIGHNLSINCLLHLSRSIRDHTRWTCSFRWCKTALVPYIFCLTFFFANSCTLSWASTTLNFIISIVTPADRSALMQSLSTNLDEELQQLQERMADHQRYRTTGRAYMLSGLSSHSMQRATALGNSTDSANLVGAYQTQSMVDMVRRSQILGPPLPRSPVRTQGR
uniref:VWA-Hint protein Vwaint domain-containing protein n=1 Tax=Ananas comosus var. bracteatus TaxID=296719 RepID=A0A6V7P1C9_ANACO|nr:unnamed protein product [Ananas comosus var. bracteatus]